MSTAIEIILALLVGLLAGWILRGHKDERSKVNGERDAANQELEEAVAPPTNAFMRKLSTIMEKRMADPNLAVDDLVKEMGMGRTVFFKRMKGLTGQSPVEFIRETRLRRAAELLRTSEQSVTEVSHAVGIEDSRYFAKCFKHSYGMTPTEYRAQVKVNG